MVAVGEFAVRECLCPCPGLGDAEVAVDVEVEEVEELGESASEGPPLSEEAVNSSLIGMITPKTRPFPIVQKNRPWSLLAHVATYISKR